MDIFRFLDWEMYKDAKALNQKVSELSRRFSLDIKKKYGSQFNRAALSISLNIAEAAGRYSDIEMCRYFDIALGSISETVACADHLKDDGCLSLEEYEDIRQRTFHISKQIHGMQHSAYKQPRTFKRN